MVYKQVNFVVYCCCDCTDQLVDAIDLAGLVDIVLEVGCKFDCDCYVHCCFEFDQHFDWLDALLDNLLENEPAGEFADLLVDVVDNLVVDALGEFDEPD